MKPYFCLAAAALAVCSIFSCRKIGIEPHPRHPGDSTYTINLTYYNTDTTIAPGIELIISEPGGSILLDSIYGFNTPIIATIYTPATVVDVTTVFYSPTFDYYQVLVDKSVQPWKWTGFPGQGTFPVLPPGVPATATYINAPSVNINTVHFGSLSNNGPLFPFATYSSPTQLDITYSGRAGNDIAYLVLPTLGLYSYHPITGPINTIDLTRMDTTYKVHYNMPSQYTLLASVMWGYYDSTDLNQYILLFNYYDRLTMGDLQYPPQGLTPVQQYWTQITSSTPDNEFVTYRTFGNPPPSSYTIPYPASPIYTFNAATQDSFSVTFAQKPTLYTVNYAAGNILVSINASPDSAQLRPLPFLIAINSRILRGKDLSTLAIQNFGYETLFGLDYNGYFARQTDPVQVTKHPYFATDLLYTKSF